MISPVFEPGGSVLQMPGLQPVLVIEEGDAQDGVLRASELGVAEAKLIQGLVGRCSPQHQRQCRGESAVVETSVALDEDRLRALFEQGQKLLDLLAPRKSVVAKAHDAI